MGLGRELKKRARETIRGLGIETIVQGPDTMFMIAFTQLEKVRGIQDERNLEEPLNKSREKLFSIELTKRGVWWSSY